MDKGFEWNEEVYRASVSSRCWWYGPYDGVWDESVEGDAELRAIVEMEQDLDEVPRWAKEVVEEAINLMGGCGTCLFPLQAWTVIDAIGDECPSVLPISCFMVSTKRKKEAMDYCFCLDAWAAGASAEVAASELTALGYRNIDWKKVCDDLWEILGEQTEVKVLLVERLLHHIRWFVKFMICIDEETSRPDETLADFGRDRYLGDYCKTETGFGIKDYFERWSRYFDSASPRVQRMENRLPEIFPQYNEGFSDDMMSWWLCAPKSFRFLERIIYSIGQTRKLETTDRAPSFLQCDDTWPNKEEADEIWSSIMGGLDKWWRGDETRTVLDRDVSRRLGERNPTKQWLVRLLKRRMEIQGGLRSGY